MMSFIGLSLASTTPAATTESPNHTVTERSIPNEYQRVNYYEKYNPQTGKYDKMYYNTLSSRYDPFNFDRYYPRTALYNRNDPGYYNPYSGRYEFDALAGRYNPYTGRYDRYDDGQYHPNKYSDGLYRANKFDDGQYRPEKYENAQRYPQRYDNGLYSANKYDDGQYRPEKYENGLYSSGKYDDKRYYPYNEFQQRYNPAYYGTGSVQSVHIPKISYHNEGRWNTLRDSRYSDENGYRYSYETENGIRATEDAHIVNKNTNAAALRKTGFYEYIGDDGKNYRVDYTADENGFRAYVSTHLKIF